MFISVIRQLRAATFARFALVLALLTVQTVRAAEPALELQRAGTNLVLRWLVNSNSYQLLQADDLTQPTRWRPIHSPVRVEGVFHQTTVARPGPRGFFELQQTAFPLPPPEIVVTRHEHRFFVQWDAVPQAASYRLYVGTTAAVNKTAHLQALPTPTTFVEVEGLTPGTTYYFVATSVNAGGEGVESAVASGIFGANADVSGRLYSVVGGGGLPKETFFLPGRPVFLSNTVSGVVLPSLQTVRRGEFRFLSVPAGTWRACWNFPGAEPGCGAAFAVSNGTVNLPAQAVSLLKGIIYGRVRLPSGDAPAVVPSPGYSIAPNLVVRSFDTEGNPLGFVNVDNDGSYLLLPAVQCCPRLTVSISSEGATTTAHIPDGFSGRLDLVLTNTPPEIQRVFLALNGRPTRRAPAGSTVHLTVLATDEDGDALTHNWSLGGYVPAAALPGLPTSVPIVLPPDPGTYYVYVRVGDGRGGYARARLEITTVPILTFSGRVLCHQPKDPDSEPPVVGAMISLNGTNITSGVDGSFAATVPLASNYLLRITAPGFVPFEHVFEDALNDTEFQLIKSPVFAAFSGSAAAIQLTDDNGSELVIPSGALVDAAGGRYFGPVEVSFSSHDATADYVPFPNGNELASAAGGPKQIIERLTLAHIDVRTAGGAPLQLASGAAVELRVALPRPSAVGGASPAAPAHATRCYYDDVAHSWRTLGTANRITNRAGVVFYGSVLSRLGQLTDVLPPKTTVETAVSVDRTLNFPFEARLNNEALPRTFFDNNTILKLGLLCTNRLRVISLNQAPGVFYEQFNPPTTIRPFSKKTVIVDKTFVANFSGVVKLSLAQHVPKLQSAAASDEYLDYPSSADTAKPALGTAYYNAIKAPPTFQQWKVLNGFFGLGDVVPPNHTNYGSASAVYHNLTDLGFVRAMSMQKTRGSDGKTNIAYYVSNFPTSEAALAGTGVLATVCMDYALRPGSTKRFTRFYVYGANNALVPAIDLDKGGGNRAVPNLCVTCHGGKPASLAGGGKIRPGDGDVNAAFIPFDLESYTYTAKKGVQLAEYAKLNEAILQTGPRSQIKNLILGWYGGTPGGSKTNFNKDYVEPTWAGHEALYRNVFKNSCRTCHITRDEQSTAYFHSYQAFSTSAAATYACGLIMPDSQRTFGIFWGSAAASAIKAGSVTNQPTALFDALDFDCP